MSSLILRETTGGVTTLTMNNPAKLNGWTAKMLEALTGALKAAGENVIGFGAGEPDFATPDHIVEAAVAACRNPVNCV